MPTPGQLFIDTSGARYVFKTYRVDRSEGYYEKLFDNQSRGFGDLWQNISGAVGVGAQAFAAYQQIRAVNQQAQGPDLQREMDRIWAEVQQVFGQLKSAARTSPQSAQQALQQGAQLQSAYEQVKPAFMNLCCTQAQGVANRINEWMNEIAQLAQGTAAQQQQPGGIPTGSTEPSGATAGGLFDSGYLLPVAIVAAALIFSR